MKVFSFTFRIIIILIFCGWMKGIAQSVDTQNNEPVRKVVEEMPLFPGCEDIKTREKQRKCHKESIKKYLTENLQYPAIAKDNGVEGTVIVRFILEKDGIASNIRIIKNIGASCGNEAVRLIQTMPKWNPGKLAGRPVRVEINLPVKFELK